MSRYLRRLFPSISTAYMYIPSSHIHVHYMCVQALTIKQTVDIVIRRDLRRFSRSHAYLELIFCWAQFWLSTFTRVALNVKFSRCLTTQKHNNNNYSVDNATQLYINGDMCVTTFASQTMVVGTMRVYMYICFWDHLFEVVFEQRDVTLEVHALASQRRLLIGQLLRVAL